MGQVWIQFWILVEWGGGKRPETLFTGHLPIPTQQKVEVSETPLQNTKSPQDTFWNPSFNTNAHNTNGHSKLLARNNASQWGYPREIMSQIKLALAFFTLLSALLPTLKHKILSPAEEKRYQMNLLIRKYGGITAHPIHDNSRETTRGQTWKQANKASKEKLKTQGVRKFTTTSPLKSQLRGETSFNY